MYEVTALRQLQITVLLVITNKEMHMGYKLLLQKRCASLDNLVSNVCFLTRVVLTGERFMFLQFCIGSHTQLHQQVGGAASSRRRPARARACSASVAMVSNEGACREGRRSIRYVAGAARLPALRSLHLALHRGGAAARYRGIGEAQEQGGNPSALCRGQECPETRSP